MNIDHSQFSPDQVIEQRIATIQGRNWSIVGNQVDRPVAYWLREENVTVDMRTISGWPQPSSRFTSSLSSDGGAAGNRCSAFLRVHLPWRSCFCSRCDKLMKGVGETSCPVVFLQIFRAARPVVAVSSQPSTRLYPSNILEDASVTTTCRFLLYSC